MQKFQVLFFLFALVIKMSFAADDACKLPIVIGPCRGAVPSYGYNTTTSACQYFTYGGCQGNGNNYQSLNDCKAACESG